MAKGEIEFNPLWMQPSGAYGHKAPESSRKSHVYKSGRNAARTKGIDRCMVKVVRLSPTKWEVHMASGGMTVAVIQSNQGKGGKTYSYRIINDHKIHGLFPTLKACVAKVLEKI